MAKATWGGNGFCCGGFGFVGFYCCLFVCLFGLCFHIVVHHPKKSRQEPGAGAATGHRGVLLSLLSYRNQDHQPGGVPARYEMDPPMPITN